MDPNDALRMLREAVRQLGDIPAADGTPLAEYGTDVVEYFTALDEWLSRGSFLPDARESAWGRLSERRPSGTDR
jgi:hypothetical protein